MSPAPNTFYSAWPSLSFLNAIETTLELWASELGEKGRMRPLFAQEHAAEPASDWKRLSAGDGTKGARLHD